MTRTLKLMAVAALLFALPAQAARPGNDLSLFLLLNGVPVKLGTITTTGASTTNATTAVTFTVTGGTVLKVTCDAAAVFTVGSAASTTYTNAAFGDAMTTGVSKYFVLRDTDTTISVASAATVNCAVAVMR